MRGVQQSILVPFQTEQMAQPYEISNIVARAFAQFPIRILFRLDPDYERRRFLLTVQPYGPPAQMGRHRNACRPVSSDDCSRFADRPSSQ
jgi:hypothetical protein